MSMEPQKAFVDIVNADTTSNSELVLDLVMSYLPTKDCVRTSILSSKWRYRWTTISILVFDRTCCPLSCRYGSAEQSKALTSIINRVLLLHNGPIEVFQVRNLCAVLDIDRWIHRVSKDSIKILALEVILDTVQYQLPSSLFTCGSLSSLKLINCFLMPPPSSFKGFKNLKFLELEYVTLTNDAFEKLISFCPSLEKVALIELKEADNLKINAPNLQDIVITGLFVSITFDYVMTKLQGIYIDAPESDYACASLIDFFIRLPNIQKLELSCCSMGFMSGDSIVESFPFQCKDLYHIAISMDFSFDDGVSTLYLYRGSSNLTEQYKEAWDNCYLAIELGVWEDSSNCPHEFKQLRWAQMNGFHGTQAELEFLKFVLGNSPVLEKMNVNPDPDPDPYAYSTPVEWENVRSIYKFKRASKAKIIFDELVTQI